MTEGGAGWSAALAARIRARLDPGSPPCDALSTGSPTARLRRLHGPRTERPVILCHGLGGNSRSFDLPGCLGPFLSRAGLDVFLLDLRGARLERWQADAVTAFEHVVNVTGSSEVAWLGHSIGGWLGLTAPFDRASPRLVIGLGTTLFFEHNEALGRILRVARRLGALSRDGVVPQATLGAIEAPLMGHLPMPPWLSWISPPRLRGPLVRQLHALALEDIPLPIVLELLGWVRASADASGPRRAASRTSCDVVLFAGSDDAWAPVASVGRTFELLSARQHGSASLEKLGRAYGHAQDVGHVELLLGAERESLVFEPIRERLLRPSGRMG